MSPSPLKNASSAQSSISEVTVILHSPNSILTLKMIQAASKIVAEAENVPNKEHYLATFEQIKASLMEQ
ncbi:hypothetical protein pipiens_009997 [Culex pipiens pipiens]|uniref:Uncharacterized protein n=1 Tax=Culex pipiens pipiens TaxID=38569 RepID=A0ABD1DBS2_CULPP